MARIDAPRLAIRILSLVLVSVPVPGDLVYFVVVGNNFAIEGSYGMENINAVETERPEATGLGVCDRPQQVGGVCE